MNSDTQQTTPNKEQLLDELESIHSFLSDENDEEEHIPTLTSVDEHNASENHVSISIDEHVEFGEPHSDEQQSAEEQLLSAYRNELTESQSDSVERISTEDVGEEADIDRLITTSEANENSDTLAGGGAKNNIAKSNIADETALPLTNSPSSEAIESLIPEAGESIEQIFEEPTQDDAGLTDAETTNEGPSALNHEVDEHLGLKDTDDLASERGETEYTEQEEPQIEEKNSNELKQTEAANTNQATQSSLFEETATPVEKESTTMPMDNQKPGHKNTESNQTSFFSDDETDTESIPKAHGENPFLPPHIRERLGQHKAAFESGTENLVESAAKVRSASKALRTEVQGDLLKGFDELEEVEAYKNQTIRPKIKQSKSALVDELITEFLPLIEERLRAKLMASSWNDDE